MSAGVSTLRVADSVNPPDSLSYSRQERDATKAHQVWLPIEARNIYSVEFLRQKVEYTHNNPVAKHWHLVDHRADYAYSSACFYDRGETPVIAVDDVREWMV